MSEKRWDSVEEVHEHAKKAVNKKIKSLITDETLQKYYNQPTNKGWIGNSIEQDWFQIPNNNRAEADIPYLGLEIKVTPIKKARKSWSAKERLVLNIMDFNDEYKREFSNASFKVKSDLIELLYYEYKKDVESPELKIKAANLLDINDLPEEDLLIIEQDWNIIVDKIKEGKAEELSDSLTKYLGATTKGSKSPKNMTTQPFSDNKAHRRAFTLKGAYMSELARKYMAKAEQDEKLIKDIDELKHESFEDIVLKRFNPYIGKTKKELGRLLNVKILDKDDKASSSNIAKSMLNLEDDIQNTEEFKKAGISVKILTVNKNAEKTTEGMKMLLPDESTIDPHILIEQQWEDSALKEYLETVRFLFVIYENVGDETYFRGAKFWRVNHDDLETKIKPTWERTKKVFKEGVRLEYQTRNKPTKRGKKYNVNNNLPADKETEAVHVRPSAKHADYFKSSNSMKLPRKSQWINKPKFAEWEEGKKPGDIPEDELTDWYMTKQAWWFNSDYMYQQIKDIFK